MVVYFLVAPFTYHPDTKLTLRYPSLGNGKVWDVYGYIDAHKLDIPDFHYPPAHFWWLKVHYPISKFIGGSGFDQWLESGSAEASFDVNSLRYNLAAKFPLLILGLVSGWLIYRIVKKYCGNEKKALRAALIWYFNPITLFSLVVMGQNDIVAIILFLSGILCYERWGLAVLFWGLAAGVKTYPIIWVIMFLLAWEKSIYKLVLKFFGVMMVYGLILLPWIGKSYFTEAVLNSGLSQRMFVSNISIGFGKEIMIVPLLLVVVALKAVSNRFGKKLSFGCLMIMESSLVILGFSHFNPQWLLWLSPFASIIFATKKITKVEIIVGLLILMSWIGLTLGFDDKFLSWGLVAPISPNLINYPTISEFARNRVINISGLINLCQSVLAGVAVWFLGQKIKKDNVENKTKLDLPKWLILLPWLLMILLVLFISSLQVIEKSPSGLSETRVPIEGIVSREWVYDSVSSLKYFEIFLDNPGLNSKDIGTLVVSDSNGNTFEKEFSGFNAGANTWLRVDVPLVMRNSETLKISIQKVVVNDGLLKIGMDQENRLAVNLYGQTSPELTDIWNKATHFWWWWMVVAGLSIVYWI